MAGQTDISFFIGALVLYLTYGIFWDIKLVYLELLRWYNLGVYLYLVVFQESTVLFEAGKVTCV